MKTETSSISLLSDSVANNLNFISSCLNSETRLCAVVKGNAYGHGIEEFASVLLKQGVNCFAVYSADEAYRLKQILPQQACVIIMGDTGIDSLEWCISNEVEFFAFDFERLNEATRLARKAGKKARVHLELETGMYRTGFENSELNALSGFLHVRSKEIHVSGICTHFAGAEL
ncbi:MAG: alanine racemase, partial [Bacteroidetes bacterium]|nr:alanine racemase [Bacteroidota bacterium]